MNDDMVKMFDTNELNRLQRCAKNKDKNEIRKWGQDFEHRVNEKYYELYKKQYMIWLEETFKDLDIALMYTLHFNEQTKFGNKRITVTEETYNKVMQRDKYKCRLCGTSLNLHLHHIMR